MFSQQDEIRASRVIFEYAAKIGQEQDLDRLLGLVADMARDLVNADRCSIWMVEPESREMWTRVAHGVAPIRIAAGHGLVGACVQKDEIILVNDALNDPRLSRSVGQKTGYETRSVLCMPLRASSGEVVGAFQALNKEGGFSSDDVNLLHLAASYSASAIETHSLRRQAEQAQVMLRELEIAREVQTQLLPHTIPDVPGFEYACRCFPAKFVGGDYYDVITMPSGRTCITLGDVSGKGIAAAVLMASIQASIRVTMAHGADSLRDSVVALNKTVHASTTAERYTTLFSAFLEPEAGRMIYINGGQAAPMLLRTSGTIERLETGGPPVGLLPIAPFREGVAAFERGDLVVIFSDGVSEANNLEGELWDEDQLAAVVRGCAGLTAGDALERILGAAQAFANGAEPSDDLTLVVLRRS